MYCFCIYESKSLQLFISLSRLITEYNMRLKWQFNFPILAENFKILEKGESRILCQIK